MVTFWTENKLNCCQILKTTSENINNLYSKQLLKILDQYRYKIKKVPNDSRR